MWSALMRTRTVIAEHRRGARRAEPDPAFDDQYADEPFAQHDDGNVLARHPLLIIAIAIVFLAIFGVVLRAVLA